MSASVPVILVSAVFPPTPMAGVPRVRAMVRYLPAHGVLPLVIATEEARLPAEVDSRIELHPIAHQGPSASAQGFRGDHLSWWRRLVRDLAATPDRYRRWASQAARLAWQLAREHRAPVLVSVPPVSAAWQVARLRKSDDPPLLVDFRDAWLDDPIRADYYRDPIRRWRERRMEALTIAKSTVCLVASPGMARAFEQRYPERRGYFPLLLNGYDETDWRDLPVIGPLPTSSLNIVYTGSFPGYQTPRFLLQALAELDAPDLRLEIIGDGAGKAQQLVRQQYSQLVDRIRYQPRVSQATALAWQQAADLLLLVVTPGPRGDESQMVITSKVFEYLRAQRPILATVPTGGDLDELLAPLPWVTRARATDVASIKKALLEARDRKKAGTLPEVDSKATIEIYRRDRQMGELARLIIDIEMSQRKSSAA